MNEFLENDVIYDDVTVPKSCSICEDYDENNGLLTERIFHKQRLILTVSMRNTCKEDPFYILSKEEMRKMIISGCIEHFR